MILGIISFTENGYILSKQLAQLLMKQQETVICFDGRKGKELENVDDWLRHCFEQKTAILFIGATGIAVRKIAPFIENKLTDSPVLVMDDMGNHIIPLLSGHVGGANELSIRIGKLLGAIPVITTATDLHHSFAIDVFAKENGLHIVNKEGIAKVSAKALRGEKITIQVEHTLEQEYEIEENLFHIGKYTWKLPSECTRIPSNQSDMVDVYIGRSNQEKEALLYLSPKEYVLGIGCKKGKTKEELACFLQEVLTQNHIQIFELQAIVSIDRKKEEAGILALSEQERIPFYTYEKEILEQVPGVFHGSAFVQSQMGVDNVCERSVMAYLNGIGKLLVPKTAKNGMTLAIGKTGK